jgi:hypothetical protein
MNDRFVLVTPRRGLARGSRRPDRRDPTDRYLEGPDAEEIVKMAALSDWERDAALAKLLT